MFKVCIFISMMAGLSSALAQDFKALNNQQMVLQARFHQAADAIGLESDLRTIIKYGTPLQVKNIIHQMKIFFREYDEFNLSKVDAFMGHAMEDMRVRIEMFKPSLKKKDKVRIERSQKEIEAQLTKYLSLKENFGKALDYQRVVAANSFFNGLGNLANDLRRLQGEKTTRIWGSKLLPFIDNGKEFVPVADEFMTLLWVSYFKTTKNKPNQAPIIDALRKAALQIAKSKKTQTEWRNLENLGPMPLDGETLNVLVFMHAHSYFDTSVQAKLPLEGLSSIGNVDVIFPGFLAKRMVKSDHIITIGHGDTMKKTVDLVRNKQLNKFFIAPEGLTPVGFYEMRPLVDDFAVSIYDLLDQGLKLDLYPISFPDNFRFLNDFRRPVEGDKMAFGKVHQVLSGEDFLRLYQITGDKQSASHLIRWIWFMELKNNKDMQMGMPAPTIMKDWLDGMVWGNL